MQQQGADTLVQFKYPTYPDGESFQTVIILHNTLASALTADNFVAGLSPLGAPTVVAPIVGTGDAEYRRAACSTIPCVAAAPIPSMDKKAMTC